MRLGLSRHFRFNNKEKLYFSRFLFIVSLSVGALLSILFINRLEDVFLSYFSSFAVNAASDSINYTVSNYFEKKGYTYSDFSNITYNTENEITSASVNTPLLNKIKADLSIYLQNMTDKEREKYICIPIGALSGKIILNNIGPKLKIRIYTTDISDLVFFDTFESAGINQTIHKINIKATVKITASCFGVSVSETADDIIPVFDTIIAGRVPEYYGSGNISTQIK